MRRRFAPWSPAPTPPPGGDLPDPPFFLVRLAAALVLCLLGFTTPARAFDHAAVARRALENHIRPGYARFAETADTLARDTEALCEAPSAARLETVRASFRETVLAWGRIEHIRFGPITEGNRHDWMIFWPDKRGIVRRQVELFLNPRRAKPQFDDTPPPLAASGLTAFDIIVFGTNFDDLARGAEPNAGRCGYALSIASVMAAVGEQVAEAWKDDTAFSADWLWPGHDNTAFLERAETTRALVQAYADGLEQTRDSRLAGPLGVKDPKLKPLTPPFPYSHLGAPLIAANIEGARALLADCGFLDPEIVGAETARALAPVAADLDKAAALAKAAADLSPEPFTNPAAKQKLVGVGFPLRNARLTGAALLSQAAGLGIGFNASDGD